MKTVIAMSPVTVKTSTSATILGPDDLAALLRKEYARIAKLNSSKRASAASMLYAAIYYAVLADIEENAENTNEDLADDASSYTPAQVKQLFNKPSFAMTLKEDIEEAMAKVTVDVLAFQKHFGTAKPYLPTVTVK